MNDDFEMYDEEEYNSKISTSSDVQNENINSYQNSGLESEIYTGASNQSNIGLENQDYDMVDEQNNIGYETKNYTQGQNINEFLSQNYSNNLENQDNVDGDNQYYNEGMNQGTSVLGNQIVNEFLNENKRFETSALAPMYDEGSSNISYEEALKTATPIDEETNDTSADVSGVYPNPIEMTNDSIDSNDFMSYDPMLQNGLETDGDYVISTFDSSQNNDYVPEKTDFDTEGVMESYAEENVENKTLTPTPDEVPVPEVYNTSGMMQFETNNIDVFNQEPISSETTPSRFIFGEMDNSSEEKPKEDAIQQQQVIGAIPIYDKQDVNSVRDKKQNSSKKALEMVATIIFFALLILVISFFPDINKFFNNIRK